MGVDGDYHVRDLYEAIERRDHPSWTLHMQIMPFDEAKDLSLQPLLPGRVASDCDFTKRAVFAVFRTVSVGCS